MSITTPGSQAKIPESLSLYLFHFTGSQSVIPTNIITNISVFSITSNYWPTKNHQNVWFRPLNHWLHSACFILSAPLFTVHFLDCSFQNTNLFSDYSPLLLKSSNRCSVTYNKIRTPLLENMIFFLSTYLFYITSYNYLSILKNFYTMVTDTFFLLLMHKNILFDSKSLRASNT